MKFEFSQEIFEKKSQISNFMKICSVGAELSNADRRTDERTNMMEIIVAFRSFAIAPKKA